ncbi:MAG: hypothetical protein HWE24_21290 [Oceanospirillaceae bacterium]|nr:hypothetical protein [Oceanospirillaceae bacterium]
MKKKNIKKKMIPSLFGMFYKDNTEDGFNLVVNDFTPKEKDMLETLMNMFQKVQECYRNELKGVMNKERGYEDGIESLTNDVQKNLELGIKNWNQIQNITTRERGSYYELTLDFGDKHFTQTLFVIMYGIYFLIQRGIITDDNYNGFQFMNQYQMVS